MRMLTARSFYGYNGADRGKQPVPGFPRVPIWRLPSRCRNEFHREDAKNAKVFLASFASSR
jgi:hypothetical protein